MAKTQTGEEEKAKSQGTTDEGGEKSQKQKQTGEPRVKQVTFRDPVESPEKEPRNRKRIRKILNQLKTQMEFYFGDANLNKDKFMTQQTESDPEGYVPISVFMSFKKIKEQTDDEKLLIKALKFSSFLQVSNDETKVRRTTPVKRLTPEEIDARTVYVEGFHKFITQEWIMKKFSRCGKVEYISMPRFKTSKEIKGYAFVEFQTPEEAAKAVKMLNRVPDELGKEPEEKVAASIKQCKNLTYYKKRATKEGIDPAELASAIKESFKQGKEKEGPNEGTKTKSKKKRKKNRPNAPQGEETTADVVMQKTDTANSAVETDENAVKPEAVSEGDDTKAKKSKKSKKKRKRKSSINKPASEDGSSQNIAVVDSTVHRSEGSGEPVKTEAEDPAGVKESGRTEEVCDSTVSTSVEMEVKESDIKTSVKKETEEPVPSSRKTSRKRPRPSDGPSEESLAKIPKVYLSRRNGDKEALGKDTGTESARYDCTSLEDSDSVWEICEVPPEGVDSSKDSDSQKNSHKKRKRQSGEDTTQQNEQEDTGRTSQTDSEGGSITKQPNTQKNSGKKRKSDQSNSMQEKAHKMKKQKNGKGPSRRSIDQAPETGAGEGRKRKRKSFDGGEEASSKKRRKSNAESSSEAVSETEEPEGKKRHRKHKPAEKEIRLRVMTKATWTNLKREYLDQQKASMRQLKDQLKEASLKRRQQMSDTEDGARQETEGNRPAPEFVRDVILEVRSEAGLCLQTLKADIPPSVEVAYIDITPGQAEGYIRCKDPESASKLLKTGLRGLSLSPVKGEPELQYWSKLIADRNAKLSNVNRRKRRGKHKILQRAQNPQDEISQSRHLIFGEDGEDTYENPGGLPEDDFNAYSYKSS